MLVSSIKKSIGKHKPGEPFELPDKQAKVLIAAGIVRVFIEHEGAEVSPRTGLPKRQYRRRDMQAESI